MATDYRPFVWFRGNCRDAFTRYTEILGGDLALLTFADAPSEEPVPPDRADLIIHASLTTEGAHVMGSDDPTGEFTRIQGMSVSVSVDGPDEARRVFDALADGGQVTAPVAETFFSPAFGMCVDRFGVPWMIVAATPDQPLGSEAPAIDALGAPPIG